MNVIPAIDLYEGKVVRLMQGDFKKKTIYSLDPAELINDYAESGFTDIHIVNLSGAKDGVALQDKFITDLLVNKKIKIQYGGGIRCVDDVKALFSKGIDRVVIGSLAVEKPELIRDWISLFGIERIVLAFDIRIINNDPIVMTEGWKKNTSQLLNYLVESYGDYKNINILCTDIDRDGLLIGLNVELYKSLSKKYPKVNWIVSGGVKNIDDLYALKSVGINNVIVGKALYEKKLSIEECQEALLW